MSTREHGGRLSAAGTRGERAKLIAGEIEEIDHLGAAIIGIGPGRRAVLALASCPNSVFGLISGVPLAACPPVLEELGPWAAKLGQPPKDAPDDDPSAILATTITYLTNNRERMRHPEYRRQELPVTTARMESLVKEVNYRVKGTEMYRNDPVGAEAILQVRVGALSNDERLAKHLNT